MSLSTSRAAGFGFLVGAVVVFLAAYSWLIGARAEHLINQTAFAAGLLTALLVVLPVMTFGLYLTVHGAPSPDEARRRQAMDRFFAHLESDGWADVFALIEAANKRRETVRGWLVEEMDARRITGYVDWRKGTLVTATVTPGTCPNCGEPLKPEESPEASEALPVPCPACRVDVYG